MSHRPAPPRGRAVPATARRGAPTARPGRPSARPTGSQRRDGARPGAGRPRTGPASEPEPETRTARVARVVSVRALALGVVLLVAFSVLLPTVRAYLGQRAELESLAAEVAAMEQNHEELQAELDRWSDEAYVAARARERLSFVMPGETAYRVIDPDVVAEPPAVENEAGPLAGPALPAGSALQPWYTTVWESVQIAGGVPVGGGDAGTEPGTGADPAGDGVAGDGVAGDGVVGGGVVGDGAAGDGVAGEQVP